MADDGPLKSLILAVDLDGVCADFYARMREVAAEWFEKRVEDLTTDVSYGLHEWGVKDMDQYRSLHRFAVTQRDLFKTVPMIPGARRVLRVLRMRTLVFGSSLIDFSFTFFTGSPSLRLSSGSTNTESRTGTFAS
jgi:5' nucleotidase, deoxy (Pyrimidine), cytosolic type C protein (NT5C)